MLKFVRLLTLLSFLLILTTSCTPLFQGSDSNATSTQVLTAHNTPSPTPTPIFFQAPFIPTPTPAPSPTTTCTFFVFACTTSTPVPCRPHYVYDDLINKGISWIVVNQQQDQNNTPSSTQATLTSTTSRTVTVEDKIGMAETSTTSEGATVDDVQYTITDSVQVSVNHSVSRAITATIGNSTTVSVPAGKTVYGNYGVKVQITDGRLYDYADCEGENSYFGPDITYTPVATGWCIWVSGNPPCPSVQL